MTYAEGQLLIWNARVLRQHALIVSGAYRFRQVSCGGVELTDDEKLKDELVVLDRHINFMEEVLEHLAEHKDT
jgi:hypothetical protein